MKSNRMHDAEHTAMAAAHEGHGGGKTSRGHGGAHAGHDRHAGHTTGMFRNRFWVSLVLSVPVVLYSDMIQMWLGFSMPRFSGSGWVAPVLGIGVPSSGTERKLTVGLPARRGNTRRVVFEADVLTVRAETTAEARPLACSALVVKSPNTEARMERVLR